MAENLGQNFNTCHNDKYFNKVLVMKIKWFILSNFFRILSILVDNVWLGDMFLVHSN